MKRYPILSTWIFFVLNTILKRTYIIVWSQQIFIKAPGCPSRTTEWGHSPQKDWASFCLAAAPSRRKPALPGTWVLLLGRRGTCGPRFEVMGLISCATAVFNLPFLLVAHVQVGFAFKWVALEQELCLLNRSEYIRLIMSRLSLPSGYDYWLAEYSAIIPQKSITTTVQCRC